MINIIGARSEGPAITDVEGRWFEPIDPTGSSPGTFTRRSWNGGWGPPHREQRPAELCTG